MSLMALITSPEAGRILGKSARTIQRMADAKEIPVVDKLPGPNGAYLFDQAVVEALRDEMSAAS